MIEIGEMTGTPTPYPEAVYDLVTLLGRITGEEHVRVHAEPLAG